MVRFQTEGICGYSVEFSPFTENRLACAGAQHFGIIGNGKQYIMDTMGGAVRIETSFDTQDGLYDCAWSEDNENHIVSASGDGSVKLWDVGAGSPYPMKSFEEHTHEVYSVDWNLVNKDYFVTGAWDDTIKLWSVHADASLTTYSEHQYCIYSTIWCPNNDAVFASASGDYTVKVWDTNESHSVQTINAHSYEILCCDWNKYNEHVLVSGSVDKTLKIWDLRSPETEMMTLRGHDYAVRRVKFSPHQEAVLASCS